MCNIINYVNMRTFAVRIKDEDLIYRFSLMQVNRRKPHREDYLRYLIEKDEQEFHHEQYMIRR